jgi:hypothetical protein
VHVKDNVLAYTIDKDRVNRIVIYCKANGTVNSICYDLGDAKFNVGSNAIVKIGVSSIANYIVTWTVTGKVNGMATGIGNGISTRVSHFA